MRQFTVCQNLTPNVKTTMYTVPTKHIAEMTLLLAHNGTSSSKHFTAYFYDSSTTTEIPIFYEYNLASKTYLRFDGNAYILFEEGDELRVIIETGATNSSCIATFELIPQLSDIKHN
jgi:hypothetical protein